MSHSLNIVGTCLSHRALFYTMDDGQARANARTLALSMPSKMLPVFIMLLTEVALVLLHSCKKILWLRRSLFIVVVLPLQSFLLSQLQILKMDPLGVHLPSSCYLHRTISRNSGTLGRPLPLVVKQMFLPPPTGSSRPRTSSAKNRSRWSSANLGRRTSGRNRPTVFRPNWSQINRNVAPLRPRLRGSFVSQKVQLLKTSTWLPGIRLKVEVEWMKVLYLETTHQCWPGNEGGIWGEEEGVMTHC